MATKPSRAAEELPATLEELTATVKEYKDSLDEQVRGACSSILRRTRACIEAGGGAFEFELKKTAQITDGTDNQMSNYLAIENHTEK